MVVQQEVLLQDEAKRFTDETGLRRAMGGDLFSFSARGMPGNAAPSVAALYQHHGPSAAMSVAEVPAAGVDTF